MGKKACITLYLILMHIFIARMYVTIWRCPYHLNMNSRVYYLTILTYILFQDVYAAQFRKLLHIFIKMSEFKWHLFTGMKITRFLLWNTPSILSGWRMWLTMKSLYMGICIANDRKKIRNPMIKLGKSFKLFENACWKMSDFSIIYLHKKSVFNSC